MPNSILPLVPVTDWQGAVPPRSSDLIDASTINNLQTLIGTLVVQVDGYGTFGDGVHDDSAAIQSAITTAQAQGGGIVVLGQKTYLLLSSLLLPAGVALVGMGSAVSHLVYNGSGAAITLANAQTTVPTATARVRCQGFSLTGTASATIGLDLTCSQEGFFVDLLIQGFINQSTNLGAGVRLLGYHDANAANSVTCERNRFVGITVQNCHIGVDLFGQVGATDAYAQDNAFFGCNFLGTAQPSEVGQSTAIGVQAREGARQNSFLGCSLFHAASKLVELRDAENVFSNCMFAFSAGDGIDLTNTSKGNLFTGGSLINASINSAPISDNASANDFLEFGDGTGTRITKILSPNALFTLSGLAATTNPSTLAVSLAVAAVTSALTIDSPTLTVDGLNHRVGLGTAIPLGLLDISGTRSAPGSLNGVFLACSAATHNATSSADTAFYAIAIPTLSAANPQTTVNAYSFYVAGAPLVGGSETITHAYALGIGGAARFLSTLLCEGLLTLNGGVTMPAGVYETWTLPSGAPPTLTNASTINPAGTTVRVSNGGAVTGIILAAGQPGQKIRIFNEGSGSITFDIVGTSHVANGTSAVIAALSCADFEWNDRAGTPAWYKAS